MGRNVDKGRPKPRNLMNNQTSDKTKKRRNRTSDEIELRDRTTGQDVPKLQTAWWVLVHYASKWPHGDIHDNSSFCFRWDFLGPLACRMSVWPLDCSALRTLDTISSTSFCEGRSLMGRSIRSWIKSIKHVNDEKCKHFVCQAHLFWHVSSTTRFDEN